MKLCSPKLKIDDNQFERINFINEIDKINIDTKKEYALSELKSDIVCFAPTYSNSCCIKCDVIDRKYTLVAVNVLEGDMYVSFVCADGKTPPLILSENGEIIEEVHSCTAVIYELYQVESFIIVVHQSVLELNPIEE